MTPKEKVNETFKKHANEMFKEHLHIITNSNMNAIERTKECAIISVEKEYNALRELLFNLRSSAVIESERVYLSRLQQLIDLEEEIKKEIELI